MKNSEAGQGLVEYALILVLVAIVVIAILDLLGPQLGDVFCGAVAAIGPFSNSSETVYCVEAGDDHVYTPLDTRRTFDVAYNDRADEENGYILDPTSATLVSGPNNGTVENNGDGTFTYQPNIGFTGVDSFWYNIRNVERNAGFTAKVTIGVGVFVKATDDCTNSNQRSIDVVDNDLVLSESDVGPITPPPENFSIEYTNPRHGRLTYYGGSRSFYYAADPDYSGLDDFEYEICNLDGVCDTARVTIYVNTADPICSSNTTASAAGSGEFLLATHHATSPLLHEVQDSRLSAPEDTAEDLALQNLLILYEDATEQDAAFEFASYPAQEIVHSIIEVLLASDEVSEEIKNLLPDIAQDFNSGEEDRIISSIIELNFILVQETPAEELNHLIAATRNHWLAACDAIDGRQVSSYEAALEALISLEEMDPGITGDAIPKLEEIGVQIEFRNAVVGYSMNICPLIIEALLDWDDLHQAIDEAVIDEEGVRQSFHDQASEAKTAFYGGDDKESGNTLCALLNHLDAQDGKHVDPASAEEIRDTATAVAAQLGIPLPCDQ